MQLEKGNLSRRGFLHRSLAALTATGLPLWAAQETFAAEARAADDAKKPVDANSKIVVGLIGCGGQGRGILGGCLRNPGTAVAAVCDVDKKRRDETVASLLKQGHKDVRAYEDFRQLCDNRDLNAVLIGTVDHWHTLTAIDAMRKGKDVYCEKPLTLTIDEGKALVKVAKATKRIFQVGSQQRSDANFRLACELARNGRVGKVQTIETWIGRNPTGGPFKTSPVPEGLNWDFWVGPTPRVDYVRERGHYTFRWWYDYSGGKLTDWGAHHNDIAQWALGMDGSGPIAVSGKGAEPAKDPNSYNCHPTFEVTYTYAGGPRVICKSEENGVLIEGEGGKWIYVRRGGICASDQMDKKVTPRTKVDFRKLPQSKILSEALSKDATRLYVSTNHMRNWLDGIRTRKECICTAEVGHRSVTVCHLGAISLRLGKALKWDPVKEQSDDADVNKMLSRPMRGEWKMEA